MVPLALMPNQHTDAFARQGSAGDSAKRISMNVKVCRVYMVVIVQILSTILYAVVKMVGKENSAHPVSQLL